MDIIRKTDIDTALQKGYRQYLTGRLQRPQPDLRHIDGDIEVGISHYRRFTADEPHIHPVATEYTYVLQGMTRFKILDDPEKEYELHTGDFAAVPAGTAYASKHAADTKILFIKAPGLNDKRSVDVDEEIRKWLSAWDS